MRKIFLALFLFVSAISIAQKKDQYRFKATERKLAVFMNAFSLLEPQQAAIGAGINYKIVRRWDMSLEFNYLFDGFVQSADDYNSQGYRAIFTTKRFSKNGLFFYGIDARLKYFSFIDKRNFVNNSTSDTLYSFDHHASNTLFGIAAIAGLRLPVSKNKRWALELNTGIGDKYRLVQRRDIPDGYKYLRNPNFRKEYNFTPDQDIEGSDNVYFPSAVRVMYFF